MSYSAIYDFETIVENAVSKVFADGGVTCVTSISDPELQKIRPRCEVTYTHGPGLGRFKIFGGGGFDYRRESCWRGTLKIDVITSADFRGHHKFRAKVRSLMANIWTDINELYLPNHKLQFAADGGTSSTYAVQEGYFASSLIYNTDLSVQDDAWALLNNNDE